MTKQQTDKVVESFLKESMESGRRMAKEEMEKRIGAGYTKEQKERIFYRYRYLMEKAEKLY